MITNRFIITGTIAALLTMSATSYYSLANGLDVLISTDELFTYLRIGLIPALIVLLVTKVPRSIATRTFVGVVSVALISVSGYYLMGDQLFALDGMMFALISIILAIEALEVAPDTELVSTAVKASPAPAAIN